MFKKNNKKYYDDLCQKIVDIRYPITVNSLEMFTDDCNLTYEESVKNFDKFLGQYKEHFDYIDSWLENHGYIYIRTKTQAIDLLLGETRESGYEIIKEVADDLRNDGDLSLEFLKNKINRE